MTETDYISKLKAELGTGYSVSEDVVALAEKAVRDYPGSAQLWHLRGHALLARPDELWDESEALRSFQKAIELDSSFAEAFDSIGNYFDGLKDDPNTAMTYFEKAAAIRGEPLG
jgi:Tfp pilus assembly protein PilF